MRKCNKIVQSGKGCRLQHSTCAFHAGYLRLQTHIQKMWFLSIYNCNNGCAKAPIYYVMRTLPVLFMIVIFSMWTHCADTTQSFCIKVSDTYCCYIFWGSFVLITDVPRYRAFSPVFIYSVCLNVVVNIMSFLTVRDILPHIFKKDDRINGTIFNILMMVILVYCTGIPVLSWIDTPKFVQYLHKWKQFQVGSNSEFLQFIVNWHY
jgi:hypothetical protein